MYIYLLLDSSHVSLLEFQFTLTKKNCKKNMVDLTPEFRKIVTEITSNNSHLEKGKKKQRNDILPPVKKNAREVQDEFLKEAYRIVRISYFKRQ